jgi:transposase
VFCGIDWSERHHDVAIVDQDSRLVARRRISDDPAGVAVLLGMLAEVGDQPGELVPVAIETPRGLLVAALRVTGRPVYPMHRPLPADSELVQAIGVLARAQQDAVWHRNRIANELRSLLREFYPGFLNAFVNRTDGLCAPMARRSLRLAPTPAAGAALTEDQVQTVLRIVGRRMRIAADAQAITAALHAPQLRQLPQVEAAFGRQATALLRLLDAACDALDDLTTATTEAFTAHPDYTIITSFPGLADTSGARVLAEIGDDRGRFADARALKAYAGSAPVTRASGRSRTVAYRRVKNQRLAAAGYVWAFSTLITSPGCRAHYDRRRAAGDRHAAAQRNLFNRLLGALYHCLTERLVYDEAQAFPPATLVPEAA